jgi:anti-sigma regulatory factor (Ser/Thr protein kinase)
VDDRLNSWGLAEVSDTLRLIVSEIVTNALIHAGSDVDVRLRAFADHVRLEVRDSDSNPPVPSPLALSEEENARAEHGRGLLIVEALSGQWNTSPNGRGKTVWLDVAVPDA